MLCPYTYWHNERKHLLPLAWYHFSHFLFIFFPFLFFTIEEPRILLSTSNSQEPTAPTTVPAAQQRRQWGADTTYIKNNNFSKILLPMLMPSSRYIFIFAMAFALLFLSVHVLCSCYSYFVFFAYFVQLYKESVETTKWTIDDHGTCTHSQTIPVHTCVHSLETSICFPPFVEYIFILCLHNEFI